jgi:hypothetical protein
MRALQRRIGGSCLKFSTKLSQWDAIRPQNSGNIHSLTGQKPMPLFLPDNAVRARDDGMEAVLTLPNAQ